jgi:hypothetical protein
VDCCYHVIVIVTKKLLVAREEVALGTGYLVHFLVGNKSYISQSNLLWVPGTRYQVVVQCDNVSEVR